MTSPTPPTPLAPLAPHQTPVEVGSRWLIQYGPGDEAVTIINLNHNLLTWQAETNHFLFQIETREEFFSEHRKPIPLPPLVPFWRRVLQALGLVETK